MEMGHWSAWRDRIPGDSSCCFRVSSSQNNPRQRTHQSQICNWRLGRDQSNLVSYFTKEICVFLLIHQRIRQFTQDKLRPPPAASGLKLNHSSSLSLHSGIKAGRNGSPKKRDDPLIVADIDPLAEFYEQAKAEQDNAVRSYHIQQCRGCWSHII